MKSHLYTLIFVFTVTSYSCKQAGSNSISNNDATQKVMNKEDSAYKEALDIHDEVMPKMGKLIGYQKKAQQRVDSLADFMMRARMTQLAYKAINEKKDTLNHLIFDLKLSEKAMNDWMAQFNAEPKLATTEERIAYFEDQKMKAQKMKDQFFACLDKARQILGE